MQNRKSGQSPATAEDDFQRSDLAQIWAQLVAASSTDTTARQFVEYFRADADRLFRVGAAPGIG